MMKEDTSANLQLKCSVIPSLPYLIRRTRIERWEIRIDSLPCFESDDSLPCFESDNKDEDEKNEDREMGNQN